MMPIAAILVGGRATRFGGRDKGALVVDGRTILDRQLDALSQVADEILLVGGTGRPEPRAGVTRIGDVVSGSGPLGGLHAALTAARGRVVIVVACDMPYVSAPLLAHFAALAGVDGAEAVVPQTERGYHPLCAAYTSAAIEPVERRLAAGQLKMTDLLGDLRLRPVGWEELGQFGDPRRLLTNVNTPNEHRSLEALHNHEV